MKDAEKPSKPYRTSSYSVRDFCHLPYAQRVAIDQKCDEQAGLSFSTYAHELDKPFTVGQRTKARPHPSIPSTTSLQPLMHQPQNILTQPAPKAFPSLPMTASNPSPRPEGVSVAAAPANGFAELSAEVNAEAITTAPAPYTTALPGVTVYQTTDYDQFKLLPENRPVDLLHVRNLKALITANNQLQSKPLLVSPAFEVFDGQHRLHAARELGVPVFFSISEQRPDEMIATLNTAQKNWGGTDWLHYWTVKGLPDYVALTAFRARYPRISFSNAKMMLGGTAHSNADEFKAGAWTKRDEVKAAKVAEFIEWAATETPFKAAAHTGFVAAVHHCVANLESFDIKEFMRKILLQPRALVTCASHKQYLMMFEEIYNYRTNEGNRLRFS